MGLLGGDKTSLNEYVNTITTAEDRKILAEDAAITAAEGSSIAYNVYQENLNQEAFKDTIGFASGVSDRALATGLEALQIAGEAQTYAGETQREALTTAVSAVQEGRDTAVDKIIPVVGLVVLALILWR